MSLYTGNNSGLMSIWIIQELIVWKFEQFSERLFDDPQWCVWQADESILCKRG